MHPHAFVRSASPDLTSIRANDVTHLSVCCVVLCLQAAHEKLFELQNSCPDRNKEGLLSSLGDEISLLCQVKQQVEEAIARSVSQGLSATFASATVLSNPPLHSPSASSSSVRRTASDGAASSSPNHTRGQGEGPSSEDHMQGQGQGPSSEDHMQGQREGPSSEDHMQGQGEGPSSEDHMQRQGPSSEEKGSYLNSADQNTMSVCSSSHLSGDDNSGGPVEGAEKVE
jgi:hypothetical protein